MTPAALATLHAAAFTTERPWSAAEFEDLLTSPLVALHSQPHGFALCRTVAGESELLTLAVDPSHQRQGIGRTLTQAWLEALHNTGAAERAFLEVASDNAGAIALYSALGFSNIGRRRAYYHRNGQQAADALVMQLDLTHGQPAESTGNSTESG